MLGKRRSRKNRQPEVHGWIGYFHLGDWWLTSFTEEERAYIEEKHKPMGAPQAYSDTQGSFTETTQTAAGLLMSLSTWFMGPGDRRLAIRMLEKAEAIAEGGRVLDRHFVYSQMIKVYYAEREAQPGAFEAAVSACERQIAIAPQAWAAFGAEPEERARRMDELTGLKHEPAVFCEGPSHRGFQQLAIIREKQGDFAEALRLCREASSQGWQDGHNDWSKRIARLERRLSKGRET